MPMRTCKQFANPACFPARITGRKNTDLPEWYTDNTLVVTYPVRGVHDMDRPEPNALFPYINALPHIDEIAGKTGMRPLALLMHWEGTAPWAPPYVWPPYGGVEAFNEFRDALHDRGHMLGVYCSGFGYTKRSNLIPEYDNTEKIGRDDLLAVFFINLNCHEYSPLYLILSADR